MTIEAVRDETPIDRTLTFRRPAGAAAAFAFVPGQFLTLSDPDVEPSRWRAYSLSSAPTDPALEVTVREMGRFGTLLYRSGVGRRLLAVPPRGKFVLDQAEDGPLLLLAGGSGVTPFRSFVRSLAARGASRETTLLHSARAPDQLVFDSELRALSERHAWFRYVPTVTRPAPDASFDGRCGRIDLELIRARCDPARDGRLRLRSFRLRGGGPLPRRDARGPSAASSQGGLGVGARSAPAIGLRRESARVRPRRARAVTDGG